MSVINQMLRDLDARDASSQERAGLPPRLRTLPPATGRRAAPWGLLLAGMVLGGLMAAGITAWMMSRSTSSSPSPTPTEMATPTPAVRPTVPAPLPPADSKPPVDLGEMKLSTLLAAAKPPVAASAVPAPVVTSTARPDSPREMPPKPAASSAQERLSPQAPTGGQIDKRVPSPSAKSLADEEYRKGMQAVKRGDNPAAEPAFRHALELEPGLAKARQALLSVLVGARRWNDAQQVAIDGLALDPTQSSWATILARLQFEQGDAAAAVDTLQRHAQHADSDADYQGLFAYLLQKQQRPAEAAERFKSAVRLRPNEARWWFGLGFALEGAGKGAEAREAYLRARELGSLPADMQAVVEQKLR